MEQACRAFRTCRGTYGKLWEPKHKVLHSIHTMKVTHTITYAALVWWPGTKLQVSRTGLSKLQRTAWSHVYHPNRAPSSTCYDDVEVFVVMHRYNYSDLHKPRLLGYRHIKIGWDMMKEPVFIMKIHKM